MAMTYAQLVTAVTDYTQNTFDTADINTMIRQAEQRIYNTAQLANLRKTSTTALTPSVQTFNAPTDLLSVYSFAVVSASGNYVYLLNKDPAFMQEAYPNPATTGVPKHYALNGPSTPVTRLQFILGPTPSTALVTDLSYFSMPESIIQTPVATLGAITGGSLYTNGTYLNVALTGGAGSGAVANIVVSGGAVTSVTLTQNGTGFVVGNTLSATAATIGGTGSGFSVPVATVGNALGTTWLGEFFDSTLLYGTLCEAGVYMKSGMDDGMYKMYEERYVQAIALLKNLGDGKQQTDSYRTETRVAVS